MWEMFSNTGLYISHLHKLIISRIYIRISHYCCFVPIKVCSRGSQVLWEILTNITACCSAVYVSHAHGVLLHRQPRAGGDLIGIARCPRVRRHLAGFITTVVPEPNAVGVAALLLVANPEVCTNNWNKIEPRNTSNWELSNAFTLRFFNNLMSWKFIRTNWLSCLSIAVTEIVDIPVQKKRQQKIMQHGQGDWSCSAGACSSYDHILYVHYIRFLFF